MAASKGNSVAVKAPSSSRINTIKVICDRCKQIAEGIRGEKFTAGFYDMTKWEEYRRENEQYSMVILRGEGVHPARKQFVFINRKSVVGHVRQRRSVIISANAAGTIS